MSEVANSAAVRIMLADYAAVDASGKVNLIGGGVDVLGFDPATAVTAPFCVLVTISFDRKFVGDSPAVELVLEDSNGSPVQVTDVLGNSQAIRIGSADPLAAPNFPGANMPDASLARPKTQMVLNFQNGLPLPPGQMYRWRVKIDHETRKHWVENFFVPGLSSGPTFG
ncbi:MAG: DUF6941 family protein [Rhodococcus sp. (in: high G+C Gram-positive bacteria)]